MEEKKYLDLLAKRDIQPTAIRILVLRTMMQAGRSVSLLAMEMGVQVAYVARATVAAHGILEGTRPVIYTVYQMMGEE